MGTYFCLKTLASLIFTSKQVAAAVIIDRRELIEALDLLLTEAKSATFATQRQRLAIIIPVDIWELCISNEKSEIEKTADSFGADIFITQK